jgi:hypothetical protein
MILLYESLSFYSRLKLLRKIEYSKGLKEMNSRACIPSVSTDNLYDLSENELNETAHPGLCYCLGLIDTILENVTLKL